MKGKEDPEKERKVWERRPPKKAQGPDSDRHEPTPQDQTGSPEEPPAPPSETVQSPPDVQAPQPRPVQPHPETAQVQHSPPVYDYSSYYQQHPYLYAHPYVLQPSGYSQPQSSMRTTVMPYLPAQYYPYQPVPIQTVETKKEAKQEEKMPERVYIQVGLVLTALSSAALFIYSMIYLFLFSREHWDPASFTGIWGLGAGYTVFAIAFGIAAATFGIISTVFLHVRTKYKMNMIMLLDITLAGIIQINPVAIPLAVAAFVFVSLCQDLFVPFKAEGETQVPVEKKVPNVEKKPEATKQTVKQRPAVQTKIKRKLV
jgi:hypothetical protein